MNRKPIKTPASYNAWTEGVTGFEVSGHGGIERICSDVTEESALRISLCLNYCADMSNEEIEDALDFAGGAE